MNHEKIPYYLILTVAVAASAALLLKEYPKKEKVFHKNLS